MKKIFSKIARVHFPEGVIHLEENWAEWLFSQGNYHLAATHFLGFNFFFIFNSSSNFTESGNTLRAVDASIHAKEWDKALEMLNALEPTAETAPFYEKIANNFEHLGELEVCFFYLKITKCCLSFEKAESLYTLSGKFAEAVEMYNKVGNWAKSFKLATDFFGGEESKQLYMDKAIQLAEQKRFTDAEEVFYSIFIDLKIYF